MDKKRYAEIRAKARAKIAQKRHLNESQNKDHERVHFDTTEALLEALRKGE